MCRIFNGTGTEFTIESKNCTYLTRRIGNTNYRIKVYTSENATQTFEDKLLRLIRYDNTLSNQGENNTENESFRKD